MASETGTTRPYYNDFEPLLGVDSTVELQPDNGVYAVETVEVLPSIGTQTFTVAANGSLDEREMRSLYLQDGALAQYRLFDPSGGVAIPDGIEITVDHGGEEAPRFNNKNSRGYYDADTAAIGDSGQQTELYQFQDTDLFFNIDNTTGAEVTFTLTYSGWAYKLSQADVAPADADAAVLTERNSLRR